MTGHWTVALFAAGCGFQASPEGTPLDGPAMIDAPGTMACPWPYTPTGFDPCVGVPAEMLPDLDLQGDDVFIYDTDDGVLGSLTGADIAVPSTLVGGARVMWTRQFRIRAGATLRVKGDNPLVLVSQSDVTIDGTVDVGSHLLGSDRVGAGSNPAVCMTMTAFGAQCEHGGSGGGGGGFGTAGAPGGVGGLTHDCPLQPLNLGIPGGPGIPASADMTLRGGCDGGDGAEGNGPEAGDGGDGGGAIQIVARDVLRVSATGKVLAGGGGGAGGNGGRSGGGGGGSGGLILLAGSTIRIDAGGVLAANGGAGGGGSNANQASGGADGQPTTTPAMGGAPEGAGGTGGNGAAGATGPTAGTGVDRGGGGGGGGAGKIGLTATTQTVDWAAVITPAPI